MSFAGTLPTVPEIDAALRSIAELRGLLDGFLPSIGNMQMALAKREQSLRDCRECLVAHQAELAERARHEAAAPADAQPVVPAPTERVLSFASLNGASSNQSTEVTS